MEQSRQIQDTRQDAFLVLHDTDLAEKQLESSEQSQESDLYITSNEAGVLLAAQTDRNPQSHMVAQSTPYSEIAFTTSASMLTEKPGPYVNDFQRLYDRTMQTSQLGVTQGDEIGRGYVNQVNYAIEEALFEGLFLRQPEILEKHTTRPFHELLSDHFTSTQDNENSKLLLHPQISPCDLRHVETYSYIPSDQFELANALSEQVEQFLRFFQVVDPLYDQISALILSARDPETQNRAQIDELSSQVMAQIRSQLFLLVFLPLFNLQAWKMVNDEDKETEGVQDTKTSSFEKIRLSLDLFKDILSTQEKESAEKIISDLENEWLTPTYHNESNTLIRNSRRARFCELAMDKWTGYAKKLSEKPSSDKTFTHLKDTTEAIRQDFITKLGVFVEAAGIYMPENESLNHELYWQPNYGYKEGYEESIHEAVFGRQTEHDYVRLVSIHRDERPQFNEHGRIVEDTSSRIEMSLQVPKPNDVITAPNHAAPYLEQVHQALSYLSDMNTQMAQDYKGRIIEQLFADKNLETTSPDITSSVSHETNDSNQSQRHLIKPASRERLRRVLAEQHQQLTTFRLSTYIGELACFTDPTWISFEKDLFSLEASDASDTTTDIYYNGMQGDYVIMYPLNFQSLKTFLMDYLTGYQPFDEPIELSRDITHFFFELRDGIYKCVSHYITGASLPGAEIQANEVWKEWMLNFHSIFSEHQDNLQTLFETNYTSQQDRDSYTARLEILCSFFGSYTEPDNPTEIETPMTKQVQDRLERIQIILGAGQQSLAIPSNLSEALVLWEDYQDAMNSFALGNSQKDPDQSLAVLVRSYVEGDLAQDVFLQRLAAFNQESSLLNYRPLWNNEETQTGLLYTLDGLEKEALAYLRDDDARFIINRLRAAIYHLELTYHLEKARDEAVRKDFVATAGKSLEDWNEGLSTGWPTNAKPKSGGLNYETDNNKENKIIYFTFDAFIESIQGLGLTYAEGADGMTDGYHTDPNRIVESLTHFFTDYHTGYYREFCPINKYRDTKGNEIYAIRNHATLDKLIYTLKFLESVAKEKLASPDKIAEGELAEQLQVQAYICRTLGNNLINTLREQPFEEMWTFDVRDYATDPKDARTVPNTILSYDHSLSLDNTLEDYQFTVQNIFATANTKPTEFLKEADGHFDLTKHREHYKSSVTPLVEPSPILTAFNDLTNDLPEPEKRIAFMQVLQQLPNQDMLYILGRLSEAQSSEFTSDYKEELAETTQEIYEINLISELKNIVAYLGATPELKAEIALSDKARKFVRGLNASETLWVQGYISSLVAATEREHLEYDEVFMQQVWQDHLDEVIFNLDKETRDELTRSILNQITFTPRDTSKSHELLQDIDTHKAHEIMAHIDTYNSHPTTNKIRQSWISLCNKLYYEDTYHTDFTWTESLYMSWRLQHELTGSPSQEELEAIKAELLETSRLGISEGNIRDNYGSKLKCNPQRVDHFLDRHFSQLEQLKPKGEALSENEIGLVDSINAEIRKQKEFLYRTNRFALNNYNDVIVRQWIKHSSLEEGDLVTHGLKTDGLKHFWTYMEQMIPTHESHPDFESETVEKIVDEIDAELYKDIIGDDVVLAEENAELNFVFDPQTTVLIRDILQRIKTELDKAIDRGVPNLENRRATLLIIQKALTGVYNHENPKELARHSRFNPNRYDFYPKFIPKGLREVFRFSNIEATIGHQGSSYRKYNWGDQAEAIDPDFKDIFNTDYLSARAKRNTEEYLNLIGSDIANDCAVASIQSEAINTWKDPVALMMVRIHLGELKKQALAIKTQTPDEIDLTPEALEASFDRVLEQIDYCLSQLKAKALTEKANTYLLSSLPNEDLKSVFVSSYKNPADLLEDYDLLLDLRNQMLPVREVLENNLSEPHADAEQNSKIITDLDTVLRLIEAYTHTVPENYTRMSFADIIQDQVTFFGRISPTLVPYLTAFEESLIQEDFLNPQGSAALIETSQDLGLDDLRLAKLFLGRLINLAHNNKHRVVADKMNQLFMNRYYLLQIRSKEFDHMYDQALFVIDTDYLKLPDEFTTVAYELERLRCSSHELAVFATELQARCIETYTHSRDQGLMEEFDEELIIPLETLSLEDRKQALKSLMKINDAFLNLNEHPFTISLLYTTLRIEKELMRTEDVRANFTMTNHVADELDMVAQLTPSLEVLAQNMYELLFHRGNNPFKEQKQVRAIDDHVATLSPQELTLAKYFIHETLDGFPEPKNMDFETEIPLWDGLKQVYTFLG
jgi:hypothetical protein